MNHVLRSLAGLSILALGAGLEGTLEKNTERPRPALSKPLRTIPLQLGTWSGRDIPLDPQILAESQADDFLNRVYEDPARPGLALRLWINYSKHGLNMRHSPEVCLPGHGYSRVESRSKVIELDRGNTPPHSLSRLVYAQADLFQAVGFWYDIFGETWLERAVRTLPITSRSSHGRTTRGSGLTVEIFAPVEQDPDAMALAEFASALLDSLEPILPADRVSYHQP
jgi:hypothetical protein